ncbi:type I-E CRISPR-associated protein Cse1/CasA [Marinobacter fonticola]|uniref:type I-E CRISPR-associated protein Cse1/CasA n=1 Tax=Marinobacter fonticola TaxID=2603215 RepID=UPI0011E7C883|nr:type I-E CRISPR-associated protein Cse1/CasA [Marinobacter fonticola]
MNLLTDPWLPFHKRDGTIEYLPVRDMASADVVDLALPRADFQGAAYQFLIGLLQTVYSPEDIEAWIEGYESPPSAKQLADAFVPFEPAFYLDGDGPRFMQDADPLEEDKPTLASSLLIDAPGASTIKNNTDHFVKSGRAETFCQDCAAMALFTMQINAPSGGKGYRTGLRGGGPLTTLLLPAETSCSLWHKLWINLLDGEQLAVSDVNPRDSSLFPWIGPTRTSEKGQATYQTDVHALHPLWAMPRRFRLMLEDVEVHCDLCGRAAKRTVSQVRARNYGNNYDGPWRHPLTPYRTDPKQPDQPPLSVKGQPGGIGYRHWESLALEDREESGNLPALVVLDYPRKVDECQADGVDIPRAARLWVFGYDMDNMKPRGWVGSQLPYLALPENLQHRLLNWLRVMVGLSREVCWQLRKSVREAWFNRPSDIKGDMEYIDARFWERTEPLFYSLLEELGKRLLQDAIPRLPEDVAQRWYRHVQRQSLDAFDELVLSTGDATANMKRITRARNLFMGWFRKNKTAKNFRKQAGLEEGASLEREPAADE